MSKTWVSSSSSVRGRGYQRQQGGRGTYAAGVQGHGRVEEPEFSGSSDFPARGGYYSRPQRYGGYQGARGGMNDGTGFAGNSREFDTQQPHQYSPARSEERQLQKQGAYYVQQPKPSQNQKLRSMAEAEEAAYTQHRHERRAQVTESLRQHEPRPLGGSTIDSDETRAKRVREQEREQKLNSKYAGIIQKRKREEHMQAKRSRENREIEERKQKQIEKAKQLEGKREVFEEVTREEMRRARLARFDPKK